jgi:hypothetical protein
MALLVCAIGCGGEATVGVEGETGQTPPMPPPPQSQPLPGGDPPTIGPTLDAKLLVLSAQGTEADLAAIRQALDYLGTPYTLWIAAKRPGQLTASALADGKHGFYQGVILTTASLASSASSSTSALTAAEWTALYNYEASFAVRQVNWYSYPTAKLGFSSTPKGRDTTASPLTVTATPAAQAIFPYLNAANPLTIKKVWAYLAKPAADPQVTPLFVDSAGNAILIEQKYPDGRDFLTLTVDSDPNLTHSLALQYGLINWVTRGVFIGERHAYIGIQIDDLLLPSLRWKHSSPYRISAADLDAALAWQKGHQSSPLTKTLTLNWAYNGSGAFETDPQDGLAKAMQRLHSSFFWLNHTFTHPGSLSPMSYDAVKSELTRNIDFASKFELTPFAAVSLVTPGVSGLDAADSMRAIHDVGVRYVVSDTSVRGQDNPSPNAGIYNKFQPTVLEIPRRPTNLGYNVLSPEDWVSEYNYLFHKDWGRDLSYDEILDVESDWLLLYMLRWENDPWMFHQENLGLYDGKHSLLTNLVDAALDKYAAVVTTPLVSLQQHELGERVAQRMQFNDSGVSGVISPGVSITLTVKNAATIPVTGARLAGAESYAGQSISYAKLSAGQSLTLPLK